MPNNQAATGQDTPLGRLFNRFALKKKIFFVLRGGLQPVGWPVEM